MSVHVHCEHYISENDMCLLFFELGFHEVSRYETFRDNPCNRDRWGLL